MRKQVDLFQQITGSFTSIPSTKGKAMTKDWVSSVFLIVDHTHMQVNVVTSTPTSVSNDVKVISPSTSGSFGGGLGGGIGGLGGPGGLFG